MTLTPHDLDQIKLIIDESLEVKLEQKLEEKLESKLEQKFTEKLAPIYARLDAHDEHIDALARATQAQFEFVGAKLDAVAEDVAVIKDIVKDHSFRIARLEHHVRPA